MKHLIIDGNNLVHRAFWITKDNPSSNHIFITLRSLKSYVEKFSPDKIWCAWDIRRGTERAIRKEMSDEYKQTRDTEYNQQVHEQTDLIVDFFTSLGIKSVYPYRGEADDVVFWMTRNLEGEKIIVSADTDFLQLISNDVKIYSPIKKVLYDRDAFFSKYSFYPEQYSLHKSLVGDKADNIIGLDQIGEKRALKILNGETKLTEAQQSQVDKNMKLIDLNNIGDAVWEQEYAQYDAQIKGEKCVPNFNLFLDLCESQKFHSIIKQQTVWHNAFCIKGVMSGIISELFGK